MGLVPLDDSALRVLGKKDGYGFLFVGEKPYDPLDWASAIIFLVANGYPTWMLEAFEGGNSYGAGWINWKGYS